MTPGQTTRPFDFEGLLLSLEHGRPQTVLATAEAGVVPFVLAAVRHRLDRPLIIIAADRARASRLAAGLGIWEAERWPGLAPVLPFEPDDVSPYREICPMRALARARLAAATRLHLDLGLSAVVLPAEALLLKTLSAEALDRVTAMASAGSNLDRVELQEQLVAAGYDRMPLVEEPGSFAVRGGVIDVWSPLYEAPARLDFFDDDVESIRLFDPETQQSAGHLKDLIMAPAGELLLDPARIDEILERLTRLADRRGMGAVRLRAVVEELQAGHLLPGLEALLPALAPGLGTLLALGGGAGKDEPIVVMEAPDACLAAVDRAWAALQVQHQEVLDRGDDGPLVYTPQELFATPDAVRAELAARTRLLIRPVALAEDADLPTFQLDVRSNSDVTAELALSRRQDEGLRPLALRIRQARQQGQLVVITTRSEGGRQRLQSLLRHYGVGARDFDGPLSPPEIQRLRTRKDEEALLLIGGSGSGFSLAALHLLVIDEEEIFGSRGGTRQPRKARASSAGQLIREVAELHEGDYVVHTDHGIGRFVRMMRMAAGGIEQDFLLLLYKDGERVYVPATGLDRVQKYIGGGGRSPTLDRLGGERWGRTKRKARKAAAEIAGELVELYARRKALAGFAFSPPDSFFREWEATFPHVETPDQQRTIDEVLDDMSRPEPAWRLVCGDVGYGKTEVAIRAAVKAALDGKQTAVLVPTTVLAEQHRLTFNERCRGLPVTVDSMSRFRTPAEQHEVIEELAAGTLDIVIGTHRLLSKDVKFKDLGLLVIDEEHRFGVKHKEQMARWRATVDCIVLTATPIPRTLQLATLGLRDLSLIATPPENRRSVRTIVCRGSDSLIAEAIERELARKGQLFYIHNRIGGLEEIAERLVRLNPGVRPVIAHGQMTENRLEEAMLGFVRGEYNALVATTIVESGLDIPNANTMFVDRADTFGLAQLYQLRGRVGRSSARAFCYLMVPDRSALTGEAAQRVAVLERFSELGSGVHIATHDLEIRGAGNILGETQSGHINEVGYDMYVQMLEQAVRELRDESPGVEIDPLIQVTANAWLPDTWLPDASQRLMAYRRLGAVRDADELHARVDELIDRFGRMPPEALTLVETLEIRVLAIALGLNKVEQGPAALKLVLHPHGRLQAEALLPLVNAPGSRYRLTPEMALIRPLTRPEQDHPLHATRTILAQLLEAANGAPT